MKRSWIIASWLLLALSAPLRADTAENTIAGITAMAQKPGECFFNPPADWWIVDPTLLPKTVKILVKAPESNKYPPCANLATDQVNCDLKTYLKRIKALNDAEGLVWRDLGTIQTKAGPASLSQVDSETNWGSIRMMHAIIIKDGTAHILTCAALRDEFPKHYDSFFKMMQSLRINPSLLEQLDVGRRKLLEASCNSVRDSFAKLAKGTDAPSNPELFSSDDFQNNSWKQLSESIQKDYKDMSLTWQEGVLEQLREELTGSG